MAASSINPPAPGVVCLALAISRPATLSSVVLARVEGAAGHYLADPFLLDRDGRRVHFSEIQILTRDRYLECSAATRNPPAGLTGAHHHGLGTSWEAVDAARTAPQRRSGGLPAGSPR